MSLLAESSGPGSPVLSTTAAAQLSERESTSPWSLRKRFKYSQCSARLSTEVLRLWPTLAQARSRQPQLDAELAWVPPCQCPFSGLC